MPSHLTLGYSGEQEVATYLAAQGFTIVGRNVRVGRAEIDIISLKDGVLHITEVKSRSGVSPCGSDFSPERAMSSAKCRRLIAAAEQYCAVYGLKYELSLDLAAVSFWNDTFRISYYCNIGR